MARHGLGHHEDAREDYTRAIEQDPQVAAFWSNRALSHYLLQAYQESIDDASQAIELESDHALARKWRRESFVALERWTEAVDDYTALVASSGGEWRSQYELALCCLAAGNLDCYRGICGLMVDEGISTEDALQAGFTAWTCALAPDAIDDYGPLITATAEAAERSQNEPQLQTKLGALLYRAGRYDEALDILENSSMTPKPMPVHRLLPPTPGISWP